LIVAGLCALCLPLFSQAPQNKITVEPAEQITVKRGGTTTETLKVEVQPGFHVNSDKPKDEFIIPLKLTWADGLLLTKSIVYPKPQDIKVGAENLSVFTGSFAIETEFQAPQQTPAGPAMVTGKLRYQACNNEMCFRPTTAEIRLPVVVQ
jgi:Disulphide bond corrector protein DsbC